MPPDTPTQRDRSTRRASTNYVVGGELETQLALANLGCIAVHVWGARKQAPRKPDWVCFDLDPDSGQFADAARAALQRQGGARRALSSSRSRRPRAGRASTSSCRSAPGPDADEVRGVRRPARRIASRRRSRRS